MCHPCRHLAPWTISAVVLLLATIVALEGCGGNVPAGPTVPGGRNNGSDDGGGTTSRPSYEPSKLCPKGDIFCYEHAFTEYYNQRHIYALFNNVYWGAPIKYHGQWHVYAGFNNIYWGAPIKYHGQCHVYALFNNVYWGAPIKYHGEWHVYAGFNIYSGAFINHYN
ncbi:hypothetical protein FOZ61_005624 [Perkinsus olseni]|uniref:Uncharacterized protein n=1 Tax=Perkinsus olseni TaxID=32597 RepID=A0A7J6MBC8_PEROL|nr:hypothetical protein FOZ61_005624 [Perkinsus olseni]